MFNSAYPFSYRMLARSLCCITLLSLVLFVLTIPFKDNSDEHLNNPLYYAYAAARTTNTTTTDIQTNNSNNTNLSESGNARLFISTGNTKFPALSSPSPLSSSTINNTGHFNTSFGPHDGTLKIPFTGLTRYPITPDISRIFGLKENTYAMLITEVLPGSPAEKAGIKGGNVTRSISGEIVRVGGDVVVKVDGNRSFVRNNEAFLNYLRNERNIGDNITLTVLRNGLFTDIQMTIEAMPNFFWYDNPDEGIRIKHPSDWRISEASLSKSDIVKFFSPESIVLNGTTTGTSVAGVFVKVFPSNDVGLDVLASREKEDTESTRNLGITPIDLSQLPGYEVVFYDYSDPDRTLKIMSNFTIKDGQIYRISFAADPPKYDDYLPLAREMMKSFQFTK